ncbi:MAG: hypothetical protein R3F41_02115 [Gammaproteobacteria bacterium]
MAELLDRQWLNDDMLASVSQGLRVSHSDEKQHYEKAIRRIQDD